MSLIQVSNLTFSYENSAENVLENINFNIDTDWKLGLIGRNGKGKTTLLRLFTGGYEFTGSISKNVRFDYFPYEVSKEELLKTADELAEKWKPQAQSWQILIQLNQIGMDPECLYRPFGSLSFGERTRVMLAVLFAEENEFLLIDEPTNHLDENARNIVKEYLQTKKGFILVSHDRDLLDALCDHMLVLNRKTVEVQVGNFSSWWENKERADAFARSENEKHLKEISKLKSAADRTERWAEKSEGTKIGFDPVKENDRSISTRSYIGAKTKKMQSRVKAFETRIEKEIDEKEGLLQDIEKVKDLKLCPMKYHKEVLIEARDLSLRYEDAKEALFDALTFQVRQGDRVVLSGGNGSGKTSIIAAILDRAGFYEPNGKHNAAGIFEAGTEKGNDAGEGLKAHRKNLPQISGTLQVGSGLVISYVNQDTAHLSGSLRQFCKNRDLNESLFLAVLRQLDFGREQFSKNMEDYSEGQKKKVVIAASLITSAHLYIWDEPLNYIDVFSRMQIEKLIRDYAPTMIVVEHDSCFRKEIATKEVILNKH